MNSDGEWRKDSLWKTIYPIVRIHLRARLDIRACARCFIAGTGDVSGFDMARGVSGVAVSMTLIGSIFAYAAIKGKTISDTVRVLAGGKPPSAAPSIVGISMGGAAFGAPPAIGSITPRSGRLSDAQLAQLAGQAGWTGVNRTIAVAVALAESGGSISAQHVNSDGSTDYGPWQVNSVHGYSPSVLLTPEGNAQAAFQVWQQDGWRPWTAYNIGAYLLYMPRAKLVT